MKSLANTIVKEDLLYYVWKTKRIASDLTTESGKKIEIIDYGVYNQNSGPDFLNGKIKIGNTIWAGNIEMHVFSSDWNRHKHQNDGAYNNVILHVVYEHDIEIKVSGQILETLVLKGKIPKYTLDNYVTLMQSKKAIPCQAMLHKIDKEKINLWKYSLVADRLTSKSQSVIEILNHTNGDIEEALYISLAKYCGGKINSAAMESLARITPRSLLMKNKYSVISIESILFGQAGLLEANYKDDYFLELKKEYTFQRVKHQLTPCSPILWKFGRLRPANFPTIRIAQFAAIFGEMTSLLEVILEARESKELYKFLLKTPNAYWFNHYRFDVVSKESNKRVVESFADLLIINAICPVLYVYGIQNNEQGYIDKAIYFLESMRYETNTITKIWKELQFSITTSLDSQAFIHLKNNYCDNFKCLDCKIGNEIIAFNY